ncbi:MAG TPA: FAD-dependent oxidoreductase [Methylovirgula sp.]|jgi:pyruvate/2-oxoglutarate dehydrogenase complex dihydrolipoamide dehydrogenase (E3) component
MTEILRPDFCVIGGGPGGLAAARMAASLGAQVVLVEKRPLATMEPVRGAFQAEILTAAAGTYGHRSSRSGLLEIDARLDFKRLCRDAEGVIARFLREDSPARLAGLNVKIIPAAGSFTNRSRFEAGNTAIEAKDFLLTVPSVATAPAIPGLELVRMLSPETIADLTLTPKKLVVIGARPADLMFVQAFLRLGSKAVLFPVGGLLADEDPELAEPLIAVLRKEGLEIAGGGRIVAVEPGAAAGSQGGGVKLTFDDNSTIEASHLIYAAGRRPRVEGLGLKAARVNYDKSGVPVSEELRTSNGRIFAIRDDCDTLHALTNARSEGEWVARRLFGGAGLRRPLTARIVPTDPEIASAGLSEAEARKRYRKVRVWRAGFCDNLRAQTLAQGSRHPLAGHIKIIATLQGRLVGAAIVGPQARELIGYFCLALTNGMRMEDFAAFAVNEPRLADVCQMVALASKSQNGKALPRRRLADWFSAR